MTCLIRLIEFAAVFYTLKKTRVRQVVLDKWLPLKLVAKDRGPVRRRAEPRPRVDRSARATRKPPREVSKAPKGNGIGATGSKNWVWF